MCGSYHFFHFGFLLLHPSLFILFFLLFCIEQAVFLHPQQLFFSITSGRVFMTLLLHIELSVQQTQFEGLLWSSQTNV